MSIRLFILLLMIVGNLKAQENKLEKISGILIFAKTDSIPQDVIFIPVKNVEGYDFEKLLVSGLSQNINKGLFVYFQGMRWRTPQLASLLKECHQTTGILIDEKIYNNRTEVQIVLGQIIFDKRFLGAEHNENIDPFIDTVQLIYNNKFYDFEVWWHETFKMGASVLFEKIERDR